MAGALGGVTGHRIWETKLVAQYAIGTRLILEDGRVFRYAKATNIVKNTVYGLKFWAEIADGVPGTLVLVTQAVGSRTIQIDSGKGAAGVAKDEFVGGYAIIHVPLNQQFRGIVGNTLADANGYVVITLDAPLSVSVTSSHYAEIYPNPYASMRTASAGLVGGTPDSYTSVGGMASVITTVANTYLWIQTWGPIWINPHGTCGATVTVDRRGLVFDREGSVSAIDESVSADVAAQYAGFIINRESVANGVGPPLVMLQISP
jgi:hypothetical protein